QEIAGAHGVVWAYLIAAVELRSRRDAAPIGSLGYAVEQQIAERVRCEIEAAVALEGGQLEIHRPQLLLQRNDAVMGDLALVLVELRRVEIADAVDGEPEPRHEAGRVRDLELAARGPENAGDARRRVDDAREIGKAAVLVCLVVQRVIAARRVLDPDRVVEKFA